MRINPWQTQVDFLWLAAVTAMASVDRTNTLDEHLLIWFRRVPDSIKEEQNILTETVQTRNRGRFVEVYLM